MDISNERIDNTLVIRIDGVINMSTSSELRKYLQEAVAQQAPVVVANMSAVPYIDSAGIATLVEFLQSVRGYGGDLVLAALQTPVRQVFELAKLDMIFRMCDCEEEALGS